MQQVDFCCFCSLSTTVFNRALFLAVEDSGRLGRVVAINDGRMNPQFMQHLLRLFRGRVSPVLRAPLSLLFPGRAGANPGLFPFEFLS